MGLRPIPRAASCIERRLARSCILHRAASCTKRRPARSGVLDAPLCSSMLYGALPHSPPIFFEKKIGSKSFTLKKHSLFWEDIFIGLCQHRMFLFKRVFKPKIKSNITLSIFCLKVVPSVGANKFAKLGSSIGSLR